MGVLSLYSCNCLKNVFNKASHIFKLISILRHNSTAKVQICVAGSWVFGFLTKLSITLEELLEGCIKLECAMFCASLSSCNTSVCLCVSHYLLLNDHPVKHVLPHAFFVATVYWHFKLRLLTKFVVQYAVIYVLEILIFKFSMLKREKKGKGTPN